MNALFVHTHVHINAIYVSFSAGKNGNGAASRSHIVQLPFTPRFTPVYSERVPVPRAVHGKFFLTCTVLSVHTDPFYYCFPDRGCGGSGTAVTGGVGGTTCGVGDPSLSGSKSSRSSVV